MAVCGAGQCGSRNSEPPKDNTQYGESTDVMFLYCPFCDTKHFDTGEESHLNPGTEPLVARYFIRLHLCHPTHGCAQNPEIPSLYVHLYRFGARLLVTWLAFFRVPLAGLFAVDSWQQQTFAKSCGETQVDATCSVWNYSGQGGHMGRRAAFDDRLF